jgi:hypothetical protein
VSTDDVETLKKFRESLKSKDTFVADPAGELVKAYDNKMPLVTYAKRTTFVIGAGRKVIDVIEGSDAIDAENSVRACNLHKPPAPQNFSSASSSSTADAGVSPSSADAGVSKSSADAGVSKSSADAGVLKAKTQH